MSGSTKRDYSPDIDSFKEMRDASICNDLQSISSIETSSKKFLNPPFLLVTGSDESTRASSSSVVVNNSLTITTVAKTSPAAPNKFDATSNLSERAETSQLKSRLISSSSNKMDPQLVIQNQDNTAALGIEERKRNGLVDRQTSSSSLCSWSSFDTVLTDDNLSDIDEDSRNLEDKAGGLTFKGKKVNSY